MDAVSVTTAQLRAPHPRGMVIQFAEPDAAYLAHAAIRRYLHAELLNGAFLIPTAHGPAIEISEVAFSDREVAAILRWFGGRRERAQPPAARG
jgi:hypothetical protein